MSDNLRLDKQLCFRVYSLNKLIGRLYAPILKTLSLTYPQYLAMLVLWQNKVGMSIKDLGTQLDLDSGTLSPLLKRMEAQGLLTRVRETKDERVVIIELTEQGIALQSQAEEIPAKVFAVTGLTPEKLNRLTADLDLLIDKLSD